MLPRQTKRIDILASDSGTCATSARLLNGPESECKPLNATAIRGAAKPRLVLVTDRDEIAAIERNGLTDPIGGKVGESWWAYAWSLARYRARLGANSGGGL